MRGVRIFIADHLNGGCGRLFYQQIAETDSSWLPQAGSSSKPSPRQPPACLQIQLKKRWDDRRWDAKLPAIGRDPDIALLTGKLRSSSTMLASERGEGKGRHAAATQTEPS